MEATGFCFGREMLLVAADVVSELSWTNKNMPHQLLLNSYHNFGLLSLPCINQNKPQPSLSISHPTLSYESVADPTPAPFSLLHRPNLRRHFPTKAAVDNSSSPSSSPVVSFPSLRSVALSISPFRSLPRQLNVDRSLPSDCHRHQIIIKENVTINSLK
ncbi:hypothetical protein CFOL_v3_05211 [Cephalotus follicularis]|uniref:Uncharacterized protein n=1 Tax=Cephalotus follicularis TaxID=3775 RepID=A0A1Q3B1D6_CEPFO|nr:hypothetical protein CFOL_v3_05211 [Cephalotus follicularis]